MTEESKTTDPTTFTFDWHNLAEFEEWEAFIGWFLMHLIVPSKEQEGTGWYEKLGDATRGFHDVELKITINGIEGNTEHLMTGIYQNMVLLARQAARDEINKIAEFHNLKKAMRALEGTVRDRLESVAREFGLTLSEEED